jgi:hypothetical protein
VGLIGRKSTAGLIGRAFIGRKSSPLPPSRAPISLPRPNPTGRRRRRISPPSRGSSPTSYAAWMASLVGAPVRRHGGRPAPRLRRQRRQWTGAGRPAAPARDGPRDTDKMHLPAREMDSLLHGSDPSPLPPCIPAYSRPRPRHAAAGGLCNLLLPPGEVHLLLPLHVFLLKLVSFFSMLNAYGVHNFFCCL